MTHFVSGATDLPSEADCLEVGGAPARLTAPKLICIITFAQCSVQRVAALTVGEQITRFQHPEVAV